jgi:glutaconate CoA-transferase subunit B
MSSGYSATELMAVVMARAFRDGEVVVMGAVPAVPLAACRVASTLHAPNLWYIVGGSGTVNPAPASLPQSSCDSALAPASCTLPLPEIVLLEGRGDALDVFCAGGLQIDAYGNCNLVAVGEWDRPALRGPGTVGLPFLPAVRRSIIYTMDHSVRTFVERVDFVSGPGHPRNPDEERPYRREGPTLVVTPLATLDFDSETRRMRLATVHPGVTEDQVRASTGFELPSTRQVPETPAPTPDELRVLRGLDPEGTLSE